MNLLLSFDSILIVANIIITYEIKLFAKIMNRTIISEFQKKLPKKFKFEQLLVTGAKALATFLQNLKLSPSVIDDLGVSVSYIRKESDDVEDAIKNHFH